MCSLIRFWREIQKFKSCRVWSCFLRNFIVAKKSKNVEIVFSIPKAMSGSMSIKIWQPLFWTDPYLPDLLLIPIPNKKNPSPVLPHHKTGKKILYRNFFFIVHFSSKYIMNRSCFMKSGIFGLFCHFGHIWAVLGTFWCFFGIAT